MKEMDIFQRLILGIFLFGTFIVMDILIFNYMTTIQLLSENGEFRGMISMGAFLVMGVGTFVIPFLAITAKDGD